jgi:hypothetical protein
MARKLQFIPNTTGVALLPLESIPQDVRDEIEEAYQSLKTMDGRIRVEFDTEDEAAIYCRQAASYAAQRPEGAVKFRRSPTKGLPKNVVDFRVTADLPANGERNANKGPNDAPNK